MRDRLADEFRVQAEGESWLDSLKRSSREADARVGPPPLAAFDAALAELADAYLIGDQDDRGLMRGAVDEIAGVRSEMYNFIIRCSASLRRSKDRRWLRRGLSAAALEDAVFDPRDLALALQRLYWDAEDAGLDPKEDFLSVAARSAPLGPGGRGARAILASVPKLSSSRESRR